MEKLLFVCEKTEKIADVLCKKGFSYNYVCKLLRNKDVKVDDVRLKDNLVVEKGSQITVFYNGEGKSALFEKVYEDENVVVVNKKAGIEVEGNDGLEGQIPGSIAVHRLDRNTEGLLIMAKNKPSAEQLLQAFKNHLVTKKYIAEVVGATNFKGDVYTAYLGKDAQKSLVKIYSNPGRGRDEIKSAFRTIKSSSTSSIVECDLLTGKTHQLRAHLAFLGHPIIGDGKYGKNEDNKKFKRKTQALVCCYLKLGKLGGNLQYLSDKQFVLDNVFKDAKK